MTKGKGKNPGAGGLNKHIKREAHKERQQPGWRKHLGAFEKHQDYSRRAKRRNEKVKKLRQLKRAAAQRNPDEFHINMTKTIVDTDTGRMRKRRATADEKKAALEKTIVENVGNMNYLAQQARKDRKRATELLEEVAGLDNAQTSCKHTVFVDEAGAYDTFDAVKHFNTTKDLIRFPALRGNVDRMGDTILNSTLVDGQIQPQSQAQRNRSRSLRAKGAADREARRSRGEVVASDEDDDAEDDGDYIAFDPTLERKVSVAKKLKEITQRHIRANTLERMSNGLRSETRSINNKLTVKEKNKYRHNVNVRSR